MKDKDSISKRRKKRETMKKLMYKQGKRKNILSYVKCSFERKIILQNYQKSCNNVLHFLHGIGKWVCSLGLGNVRRGRAWALGVESVLEKWVWSLCLRNGCGGHAWEMDVKAVLGK